MPSLDSPNHLTTRVVVVFLSVFSLFSNNSIPFRCRTIFVETVSKSIGQGITSVVKCIFEILIKVIIRLGSIFIRFTIESD